MPNGVKYSTTTPSGSLRRDNVALGVNGNLGPTANTGFYSMPTPVSGKYIINKVAASGVPNFFAPQNDTELIQFARNEGATGANTGSAAAVLSWIATQANLEAANFEYEGIVTDGLVLNLDAGFVGSYPTINTTWYDISGNANNGTLTNGPTFNSANSGSIVFDGVDDYVDLNNNGQLNTLTSNFTWNVWIKTPSSFDGYKMILSTTQFWCYLSLFDNQFTFDTNPSLGGMYVNRFGTLNTNTWYNATVTRISNIDYCYINGSFINSVADSFSISGSFNIGRWNYNNTLYYNSNITIVQIYNKGLSATEVLQNFNAQKGRFGL
jgi:hypothetical protein